MTEHANLIGTVCRVNPGAKPAGFRDAVAQLFLDTGEIQALNANDSTFAGGVKTLRQAREVLTAHSPRRIPDAYELRGRLIVVWEVALGSLAGRSRERWHEFVTDCLDVTGHFGFALIEVNAAGVCNVTVFEPFRGDRARADAVTRVFWKVDEPCPIDWAEWS